MSAYTQRKSTLLPSHQDLAYFLFFPGQTCFPHRQHKGSSSSTASYVMGETHMNENEEARVERTHGTRRAHPSWRRKQSNSEFSIARPTCADTGTTDTGILQRCVRGVKPLCLASSRTALLQMEPHAFPTQLNLPWVRHYLRAEPTLDAHTKPILEGLPCEEGNFSVKNVWNKFSVLEMFFRIWEVSLTWACSFPTKS